MQITELAQIVGKSYENADFQNFVRKCYEKSYEKVMKILRAQLA